MRVLILGGRRFLGRELVKQALEQGHDVSVVSLEQPADGVRWYNVDRHDVDKLKLIFSAVPSFDAVIDNIAYKGSDVHQLIEALGGVAHVKRYVLTSSVDTYENKQLCAADEVLHERLSPTESNNEQEKYRCGKRECELALRSYADLDYAVLRPTVVTGRWDNIATVKGVAGSRSIFFPLRLLKGGPILLLHEDVRPYQLVSVKDVASAMLLVAAHPNAKRQTFNVTADAVWTTERLVVELAASIGKTVEIVRAGQTFSKSHGLDYRTPYLTSGPNPWSMYTNDRLRALGWKQETHAEWMSSHFSRLSVKLLDQNVWKQEQHVIAKVKEVVPYVALPKHKSPNFLPLLSSVGIGTYLGDATEEVDGKYLAAVKAAVRGGINVIDTAINYRNMRSEVVVGQAIRELTAEGYSRDDIVLVTKGGYIPGALLKTGLINEREREKHHSIRAQFINVSLKRSLLNLQQPIDLYLLHNPESLIALYGEEQFYEELTRTFALLEQRVRDKSIKGYGLATWEGFRVPVDAPRRNYLSLERALACARLAAGGAHNLRCIELPLNPADREAFTLKTQAGMTIMEAAKLHNLIVLTSYSIRYGTFEADGPQEANPELMEQTQAERALQFTRSVPGVTCALVGMKQLPHVASALKVNALPR